MFEKIIVTAGVIAFVAMFMLNGYWENCVWATSVYRCYDTKKNNALKEVWYKKRIRFWTIVFFIAIVSCLATLAVSSYTGHKLFGSVR